MTTQPETRRWLRGLIVALRSDREFRATFLGAIVPPTLCVTVMLVWIVRAIVRPG